MTTEAQLRAEAEASAAASPHSAVLWGALSDDEKAAAIAEAEAWRAGAQASAERAGFASPEDYLAASSADALADAVAVYRRWLLLPDPGVLYIIWAAVIANRAEGDPTWLLVVGPPGGGKTETLQPVARLRDVHPVATLTEAALLSGTSKRERDASAKGGLLREIGDFGIILCKDFGSVLSMNRDARAAVLAALREVYDGSWTRHVGTDGGRTLSWAGKVGLLAGCTPAIDSHHAVMGSMGERFILYRLPSTDADQQARRALSHVGHEAAMRRALGEAVERVLAAASPELLTREADPETTDRLVNLSTLAVRCRSAVERDSYSREVLLIPEAEAPARMALVLLRLLNAMAAIGVDAPTRWRLVAKCALDSMPAVRRSALEALIAVGADDPTTTTVAEAIGYPTTTARRALEDLAAHGIVRRIVDGPGRADRWAVSDWTRSRWPTVPEMSGGMHTGTGYEAATPSYSPPLRAFDDISGTVPPAPSLTVACRDYRAHQSMHRRVGGAWTCDACKATG